MKGDRLIYHYFSDPRNTFRRYTETVEVGELLLISEIAERTGKHRSQIDPLMLRLHKRGIVEKVPFVWPDSPKGFELWGRRAKKVWRRRVSGERHGRPGTKWLYLGFTITPVDELLMLAILDLTSLISMEVCMEPWTRS